MVKINWNQPQENKRAKEVAERYGISPYFTTILFNRGFKEEEIIAIIENDLSYVSDPTTLVNAEKAAKEIADFIKAYPDGTIVVQADYDCDGITSGYIMGHPLAQLHSNVIVKYPERSEGYGLQMNFCKKLIQEVGTPLLVITVDNGVTAVDEVQYLLDNGAQVVITDHHTPKEVIPNCTVVDPHCYAEDMNKGLAGCGVAFKTVQLITRHFDIDYDFNSLLPVLAIGTVADMMPITLDNLFYIRNGLGIMNDEASCPNMLQAFKTFKGLNEITPVEIGWEVGPAINSCGRMGNILLAGQFIYADEDVRTIMDEYIAPMLELNETRKELTKKYVAEAASNVNPNSYVNMVLLKECHEGLAGVVANKVMEINNKPTIVLVDCGEYAVGSARATDGLSILELLNASSEYIERFGGHDGAAGLTIKSNAFYKLQEHLDNLLSSLEIVDVIEDDIVIDKNIDFEITLKDLSLETLQVINALPYDKDIVTAPIVSLETMVENIEATQNNPNNAWLTLKDGRVKRRFWVRDAVSVLANVKAGKKARFVGTLAKNFMKDRSTPVVLEIIEAMTI